MKNEKGLTLVEVLASLVIISIVLMGFMALFTTSNRVAVTNSEKLVITNLADAYLERLQTAPTESLSPFPLLNFNNCKRDSTRTYHCFPAAETAINGKSYDIQVQASQTPQERQLSLLTVVVTVKSRDSGMSTSVEGYVAHETD